MRKILYLLFFIILIPCATKAACPVGANYINPSAAIGSPLVTLASLGITQCYYVAATGSDSNSGLTESAPFAHALGMGTCAANCDATKSGGSLTSGFPPHPPAGTAYIFRGGDTWHMGDSSQLPYTGFVTNCGPNASVSPAAICFSSWIGTATNPIYYGVDLTWFSGGSWVRPIFTADNPIQNNAPGHVGAGGVALSYVTSCSFQAANGHNVMVYPNSLKYVYFDNFEMTGLCQDATLSPAANGKNFYLGSAGAIASNWAVTRTYIHGWTHFGPYSCVDSGSPLQATGHCTVLTASFNPGLFFQNVIDGSDSDPAGLDALFGTPPGSPGAVFAQNVIRYVAQVIVGGMHVWAYNIQEHWYCPGDDEQHPNVLEESGGFQGINAFYNNIWDELNTDPSNGCVAQSSEGVILEPPVGATDYDFNNIMWHEKWTEGLGYGGHIGDPRGTINDFNNTWEWNDNGHAQFEGGTGVQNITNDHVINTVVQPPFPVCPQFGGTCNIGANFVIQTDAQAASSGYTPTQVPYAFAPTSSSSPTVGRGANYNSTYCAQLTSAAASDVYLQDAAKQCGYDTSYACTYNATTHTVTACPGRTPVVRPTTANWDTGAYQFTGVTAPISTVTWTNAHQTMDGFGGEDSNTALNLTNAQADLFFSPSAGIGLEIVRTGNFGCPNTGACSVTTGNVTDLVTLQKATARGATVDLNIQSPPANMKFSGTFQNGAANTAAGIGQGTCLSSSPSYASNFTSFANYTVQWIQLLQSNSVPIKIINVANESDAPSPTTSSLGACVWTAAGLDTYIGTYLGPALTTAGLTSVKVMLPNSGFWFGGASGDQYSVCLNDVNCSKYVGYVAMQGYGTNGSPDGFSPVPAGSYCCGTASAPPNIVAPYHVWQSEINGGYTYQSGPALWTWDPSIADAMVWARNIHDYLTIGNVSAWEYWQLADCCPSNAGAPFNDGLTLGDLSTTSKRFYVVGSWSKFVRPGAIRIDTGTNPQANVFVTAFKNTDGSFAIIALNSGGSAVQQTFNLSAFPSITGNQVIPYLTDVGALNNLAQQSSLTINTVTHSFTATLNARSVTTFSGTTSTTSPAVTWSPTSFAFGSVTVNASSTTFITLQNTGTAPLNISLSISGSPVFTIINGGTCVNGSTVAAGGNCTVKVQFAPTSAVVYSGGVVENDPTNGVSGTAVLSGTGAAAASPAVTWTPSSFNFGSVGVGNTPTSVFTLKNTGNATLNVSLSMAGSSVFTNVSTTCGATLTASSTCTATVQFAPTGSASYSGSLVETDATNSVTGSVALSGSGVGTPVISLSPTSFNFGNVTVGQTPSQSFTLKNTGTAVLNITSIAVSGTGFSQSNSSCGTTLAVNATCIITATFSPTAATSYSGTLTVSDTTDGISSGTAALSGTGTAVSQPIATWSPSTFNFGNVATGTTPTQIIVLTNTGNANLNLTSIVASGTGFSQSNSCLSPLTAGSQCSVTVTFSPVTITSYSGTLTVTDTPNNVSSVVPLSGAGITPALPIVTWTPATTDFGGVPVNGTATQIFTLTNTGSATLNVSLSVTGGPILTFSESDNCGATLAVNAQCQVAVQFVPTEAVKYTGFLIETDTANSVSGSASLSGTGIAALGKNKKLTL